MNGHRYLFALFAATLIWPSLAAAFPTPQYLIHVTAMIGQERRPDDRYQLYFRSPVNKLLALIGTPYELETDFSFGPFNSKEEVCAKAKRLHLRPALVFRPVWQSGSGRVRYGTPFSCKAEDEENNPAAGNDSIAEFCRTVRNSSRADAERVRNEIASNLRDASNRLESLKAGMDRQYARAMEIWRNLDGHYEEASKASVRIAKLNNAIQVQNNSLNRLNSRLEHEVERCNKKRKMAMSALMQIEVLRFELAQTNDLRMESNRQAVLDEASVELGEQLRNGGDLVRVGLRYAGEVRQCEEREQTLARQRDRARNALSASYGELATEAEQNIAGGDYVSLANRVRDLMNDVYKKATEYQRAKADARMWLAIYQATQGCLARRLDNNGGMPDRMRPMSERRAKQFRDAFTPR